jgi:hypothetical protein
LIGSGPGLVLGAGGPRPPGHCAMKGAFRADLPKDKIGLSMATHKAEVT